MNKTIDSEILWRKGHRISETQTTSQIQKLVDQNRVIFSRSIKLSSDTTIDVYKTWGIQHAQAHDYTKSVAKLSKALAMQPGSTIITDFLGSSLNAINQHQKALICYKKALQVRPSSCIAHEGLLQTLKCLERFKDYESSYEEFLEHFPENMNNPTFHFQKAEALVKFNEYPAAFASYRKTIELNPENCFVHFQFGLVLYQQFCFEESLYEFERAASIQPTHREAQNNIAFLKYHLGQIHEAIAFLEYIIENRLKNFTTFPNMILFQYHLYQNEDCIAPYLERFRTCANSDYSEIQRAYNQDIELTERMMKESLDEKIKDFSLKKIDSIKMMLSLLNKLRII